MSGTSLIFSPTTPDWARIRSIESSYQVSLIADNPSHLRHFIVESQAAQYQALAAANTRLAQVNAGLLGIQSGLSDLTWAVQEGFEAVGAALDGISGQIADLGYALEQGFTALAGEMQREPADRTDRTDQSDRSDQTDQSDRLDRALSAMGGL